MGHSQKHDFADPDNHNVDSFSDINNLIIDARLANANNAKLGDNGITNYTEFSTTGNMRAYGSARCWKDINYNPNSLGKTTGSNPDTIVLNGTNIEVSGFSPSTEEEVSFSLELDHEYAEGTDIKAHVHWLPSTNAAGNVVWGLEYVIVSKDDVVSGATTATVTVGTDSTAWKQHADGITTISGTGLKMGDIIYARFYRDATSVNDTYVADACATSIGFHIQVDSIGSIQEFLKD